MIEMLESPGVAIILSPKSFERIRAFLKVSEGDEFVALLLRNTDLKPEERTVLIDDIILPPQSVSGSSCVLDADKFANEVEKIIKETPELMPKFCGVIHSHNSMSTFFSTTDDEMHQTLLKYMSGNSIFVSIVINDKLETQGKVLIRVPFGQFEYDKVSVIFDYPIRQETLDSCKKEWKKKIKIRQFQQEMWFYPRQDYRDECYSPRQSNLWQKFPDISKKTKKQIVKRLRKKLYAGEMNEYEWNSLFDLEWDLYGYSTSCNLDNMEIDIGNDKYANRLQKTKPDSRPRKYQK